MNDVIVELNEEKNKSLKSLTQIIYVLYALHFFYFITAIVAVIVNYVKKDEVAGTWLESHFRWQIRTFWYGLLWAGLGGVFFVTLIGIPLALAIWFANFCWMLYRVIKGWLNLNDNKPMSV
ncbi:MAG: hypothetical protein PHY62_03160 [Gallionella sp.]|jgi:uncharacterized membrane protein|nr:hypothetical protein [Gallionella sp.]